MAHKTGLAKVFRGGETIGNAQYHFEVGDDGRVTGWIVDVEFIGLPAIAGRVPGKYLPVAIVETDLHLSLPDGTVVDFFVADTETGRIENGRLRPQGKTS